MSHNTLHNYYQSTFNLTALHKICTLTELENMIPFEKDVYIALLEKRIQDLEEQEKQ
jgi:hypothetical protein